jgi:hypothetical protein
MLSSLTWAGDNAGPHFQLEVRRGKWWSPRPVDKLDNDINPTIAV